MKIVISSSKFSPGQRAIIDKDSLSGRHLKLSSGDGFVYINAGARCIIKSCLLNDILIVMLDESGLLCEVDSKNLSLYFERKRTDADLFNFAE